MRSLFASIALAFGLVSSFGAAPAASDAGCTCASACNCCGCCVTGECNCESCGCECCGN